MNVLRWLSRAEYALCIAGLAGLVVIVTLNAGFELTVGRGLAWASAASLFALLLCTLFGMGPALAHSATLRRPVRSAGYALTAVVFFVLFCLATYVSSETRALGDIVAVLGWPAWLLQSLFVVAFGANVLRFSVYAVNPSLNPRLNNFARPEFYKFPRRGS